MEASSDRRGRRVKEKPTSLMGFSKGPTKGEGGIPVFKLIFFCQSLAAKEALNLIFERYPL